MRSFAAIMTVFLAGAAGSSMVVHAMEPMHQARPDTRRALPLNDAERAFVRQEMRDFLAGVQAIAASLGSGDFKALAQAARARGMAAAGHAPASLRAKLPMEFRQFGQATHRQFDTIALDAETFEDPRHTAEQLAELLGKCITCHAVFRAGP